MAKKNAPVEAQAVPAGYVPALKKAYKEEIVEKLTKQFSYTTVMQVPRLVKITINEGVGDATQDKKIVEEAAAELSLITGQKACLLYTSPSLIRVALPRIRDFNGIAENMDGRGNYTLGLKEQIIFPEIDIDKNPRIHGLEITFVTTARTDEECHALLAAFGLPFKKHNK